MREEGEVDTEPEPDLGKLRQVAKAMRTIDDAQKFNKLAFYVPYPKQRQFHDLGLTKRERYFRAGNRLGKTFCGASETAYHLTGRYPDDWKGRRFTRPVKWWAGSDTGTTCRDVVQKSLCGPYADPLQYGSGMIPRECVAWKSDVTLARGVTDLFDTVLVQHETNGVKDGKSILTFKTYEQGRKKWQGDAIDGIWCDEEPDMDVYSEALTRIAPTKAGDEGGLLYLTSTPLLGRTALVKRFMDEPSPDRAEVLMTMEDALHISPEAREKIIAGYPAHERAARRLGVPFMGSGLIFTAPEDSLKEGVYNPWPAHWFYLWSFDFGFGTDHPWAAVLNGWDKDADCVHVLAALRSVGTRPLDHAAMLKPFGADIPIAWPQDGHGVESTGLSLANTYKAHKLKMLDEHATFPDGGLSTETGILQMEERMTTGRYKVASHLTDWFEEYRNYHRKDGLIVKKADDLMSASRIGIMMLRAAKRIVRLGSWQTIGKPQIKVADGVDDWNVI